MLRQKMWKWHRWVGYIIGLQILLWITGGLVMTWFDIEQVRGEHNIVEQEVLSLSDAGALIAINDVISEGTISIRLRHMLDTPVYDVTNADGSNVIISASTGEVLSPLDGNMAEAIAVGDFSGTANPQTTFITETNTEYRGAVPVWQVQMHDEEETRIYVSPSLGRVVARRNGVWRLFDFFWMLHIMDYEDRTDFNNPLVIAASFIAFLFTITGFYLIYYRLMGKSRKP